MLTNREHVPIEQARSIDAEKVNRLVEYPSSFEIVPAFGVEMIHAMAHTEKPSRLVTRHTRIERRDDEEIDEGADQVVRHRGIARSAKKQVAEQAVQLTTMRGPASGASRPWRTAPIPRASRASQVRIGGAEYGRESRALARASSVFRRERMTDRG